MDAEDEEFLAELKACGYLDAAEHEKLTLALKGSQERANKASLSVEVDADLESTTDDPSYIAALEEALKIARQKNKEARDRLKATNEKIEVVQRAISELRLRPAAEINFNALLETKHKLTEERCDLLDETKNVTQNIEKAISDQQELEVQQREALEEISKRQMDIQACRAEVSNAMVRKERAEKQLEEQLAAEEKELVEVKELNANCKLAEERQQRLEENIRLCKAVTEEVTQKLEEQEAKNRRLLEKNKTISEIVEPLLSEIQRLASVFTTSEAEVKSLNQKTSKLMQMIEDGQKRLDEMVDQKMQMEEQQGMLITQRACLEQEMELCQKQAKIDDETIKELIHIKDLRSKELIKATKAMKEPQEQVKLHAQTKKNLEQEIKRFKSEACKQQKMIDQLRKKRESLENETILTEEKIKDVTEEAQKREEEINQCSKNAADVEEKCKQMQHLYEAAKCEEAVFSNQFRQLQDKLSEMKRLISMMQHEEYQLKENLREDEIASEKVTQELLSVEDECTQLKVEQHDMENKIQETKCIIDKQEAVESQLLKVISDTDTQIVAVARLQNQVVHKRSLLARKLAERSREAESLCKTMKVQQNLVNERQAEYCRTVEKIQMLKMEIGNLAEEKRTASKAGPIIEDLRHEVIRSQKELIEEQIRYKASEADIQIPKNVHQWRRLKLLEPETYELIQKLHSLQRRERTQSRQAEEREIQLQLSQKTYMQHKHVLAQQPGLEVAEQLRISHQNLTEKREELKRLREEATARRAQNKELKNKIDMLDRELRSKEVKRKCGKKKR